MEKETAIRRGVPAGDPADWRLICVMSAEGMCAYLKNVEDPSEEIVTLLSEQWDAGQTDLLQKIESTVYDNPQLLDDFSADIAIVTPSLMWVPSHVVDREDDGGAGIFRSVYPAADEDVMVDEIDGVDCLYMLVPGLQAFLRRTFPGARCSSHLSITMAGFRERAADMPRVYIDIRRSCVDFVAFDGDRFLAGVSRRWNSQSDIKYHLMNLMEIHGLDPAATQVSLSGLREVKTSLMKDLRKDIAFVMLTLLPSVAGTDMPLAAALLLRK